MAKGAVYTGTTLQLDRICKQALPDIKEVITQNYVGYNKEYGVYVLMMWPCRTVSVLP